MTHFEVGQEYKVIACAVCGSLIEVETAQKWCLTCDAPVAESPSGTVTVTRVDPKAGRIEVKT